MEQRSKHFILYILALVWILGLNAQDRYMVFFKDKAGSSYRKDAPQEFLSARSIERRLRNNVTITEQDLPVNESYIQGIKDVGLNVFFTTKWMNGALVQMSASDTAGVLSLEYVSDIEYIGADPLLSYEKETYTVPQTFLETEVKSNSEFQLALIGADQMHADGYRGEGIYIAVFDNGFTDVNNYKLFEHLFRDSLIVGTRDFIRNTGNVFQFGSHGSSVLSCIASDYNDAFIGTAPYANYILCVTEDSKEYRVEEYNWLLAAEYADSLGVDVINTSVAYYDGFTDDSMSYTYEQMDGETTVITRAAQWASERGIVVVASAGNAGLSNWKYITAPADGRDVLAVGSIDYMGNRSSFSSFGPTFDGRIKPDVCTLGSSATVFESTSEGWQIETSSGTSFSSPQIAGLAAGLLQANPDWTREELVNNIKFTASQTYNPDYELGYGVPNYEDAMVGAVLDARDVLTEKIKVYPNPFKDNILHIHFGGLKIRGDLEVAVFDERGVEVFKDLIKSGFVPEEMEVQINATNSGIYFLKLRSEQFDKTVKLIKI